MLNINNLDSFDNYNTNNTQMIQKPRTYIPSPFPSSFFNEPDKDEYIKTPQTENTSINAGAIGKTQHNYMPSPYRTVKQYEINPQTEYVLQNAQIANARAISLMNGRFL